MTNIRKGGENMKRETKAKQIVLRFENTSYDKICYFARIEHRGLGEFVRHAVLVYMEQYDKKKEAMG